MVSGKTTTTQSNRSCVVHEGTCFAGVWPRKRADQSAPCYGDCWVGASLDGILYSMESKPDYSGDSISGGFVRLSSVVCAVIQSARLSAFAICRLGVLLHLKEDGVKMGLEWWGIAFNIMYGLIRRLLCTKMRLLCRVGIDSRGRKPRCRPRRIAGVDQIVNSVFVSGLRQVFPLD